MTLDISRLERSEALLFHRTTLAGPSRVVHVLFNGNLRVLSFCSSGPWRQEASGIFNEQTWSLFQKHNFNGSTTIFLLCMLITMANVVDIVSAKNRPTP